MDMSQSSTTNRFHRRHFLKTMAFGTGAAGMPAFSLLMGGTLPLHGEESRTKDVCDLDYPPVGYGNSLEEVERTIQEVIEKLFRDPSGLMRSGVNGKTMKPYTPEDVTDRQFGVGSSWENASIPREYKNIANNFENCHETNGRYLCGLVDKYKVTGDAAVLELARRTVDAERRLWEEAGKVHRYGLGWMPKPYAGMEKLAAMDECSVDQYSDLTAGLEKYYHELATEEEREVLREMFLSFADWWIDHNYTTSYFGRTVWWDRVHDLAQSYFLYLFTLAYHLSPKKKYRDAFHYIFGKAEPVLNLRPKQEAIMHFPQLGGLTISSLARMTALDPSLQAFGHRCIRNYTPELIRSVDNPKAYQATNAPFAAKFLTDAHQALQDDALLDIIAGILGRTTKRTDFYRIKRGIALNKIPPNHAIDGYRDAFWGESMVCWFSAYWYVRRHRPAAEN